MRILAKEQYQHRQLQSKTSGELYSLSQVISEALKSKQLFFHHDIVSPSKKSSSPHRHSVIEEVVYVISGKATIVCDDQRQIISEGTFILFDPKELKTHYLMNETNENVETLTFSISSEQDKVIYENTPSWKPPTIETPRLILRAIELDDAENIFAYARNPNVSRYTLWEPHQTIQDSLNYINEYILGLYSQGVPEPFGIAMKEKPKKIIGTVGCFWTSRQAKAMELAYAISEDQWGKGLVAEAADAVMDFCKKEYSLKRIQARCKIENKASSRVMEKIGMSFEGTLLSAIFHRNRYWDMHYYAKIFD